MDSDSDDDIEYELDTFTIGEYTFDITTVSYLPIQRLMKLQESRSEISGQKLWCGSVSVIEYVLEHPDVVKGRTVIELGAGTGLLGMTCSRLGAKSVYLTDHDERSLAHMREDCQRNHIEAVEIHSLDWFQPDLGIIRTWSSSISPLVIVAGDVLYKDSLIEPMLALVAELLIDSGAIMLLCHIPRAGVEHEHVLAGIGRQGLTVEIIRNWRRVQSQDYCPQEDIDRAQIYLIRR